MTLNSNALEAGIVLLLVLFCVLPIIVRSLNRVEYPEEPEQPHCPYCGGITDAPDTYCSRRCAIWAELDQ